MTNENSFPVEQDTEKKQGDVAPDYKGPQPDYLTETHKKKGKHQVLNEDGSLPELPDRDITGSGALDGNTTE
jgi:hypothetical protein